MFAMFNSPAMNLPADQVKVVPAKTIMDWMESGDAVIIDVREVNEYVSGHIPGAHLNPLSSFDASKIPPLADNQKLVIHCRSGNRCGMASAKLVASGYQGEINRMQGGIFAWYQSGGALEAGM